jgi:hypothetical protein
MVAVGVATLLYVLTVPKHMTYSLQLLTLNVHLSAGTAAGLCVVQSCVQGAGHQGFALRAHPLGNVA